jgi:hypothetical protein
MCRAESAQFEIFGFDLVAGTVVRQPSVRC